MQFLIIGVFGVIVALVLFLIGRYLLRWRRSYTLIWPANAGQREQAHICRAYLARAGIVCQGLMIGVRTFDLIYRTPHNTVHIAFTSPFRRVSESLLRDLNSAVSTDPKKIPVLIVHRKFATPEAIVLARDAKMPLLRPADIPSLRDLIKAGGRIKRQHVLMMSYNAFNPPA